MLSIMPTSPAQYSSAGSSTSPTASLPTSAEGTRAGDFRWSKVEGGDENESIVSKTIEKLEAAPKVRKLSDEGESEVEGVGGRKSKDSDEEHDVAFTILQDDDLEVEDKNDEGIGSTEELCLTNNLKTKRASSGIYEGDSSPGSNHSDNKAVSPALSEDVKVLCPSNSSLLQAKLMALTQTPDTDQEDLLFTKTLNHSQEYLQKIHKAQDSSQDDQQYKKDAQKNKTFHRINNLNREKIFSVSNGHLNHQKTFILRKDYSQSYNNIEKPTDQRRPDLKKYHQNCYSSGHNVNKMVAKSPNSYSDQRLSKTRPKRSTSDTPTLNNNNTNNKINNNVKNQQYDSRNLNNGRLNNSNANIRPRLVVSNNNCNNSNNSKPVFVTTVKKGEFLEPPSEIAYLLGYGISSNNSANGSNMSLNSGIRDRHQQQALFYSFSSQPRVLNQTRGKDRVNNKNNNNNNINNNNTINTAKTTTQHQRSKRSTKVEDEDSSAPYGNLMYDRRVVRGSTIASTHPAPWNPYFGYARLLSQPQTNEDLVTSRQQEARRRAVARRRAQGTQNRANQWRSSTPPPVTGRRHEVVQTDRFLEELFLHPPEADAACQTELFPEEPETPLYIPAPQGVDAETQVYPGELFDWETEVSSLLEVLVGKNIQEALAEVMEEEELAILQDQHRQMAEIRAIQMIRVEEVGRQDKDNDAAAILTKSYLAEALPSVLDGLKEAGYALDDVKLDGEEELMPWLMSEVSSEMNHMVNSKDILTDIVREILETRAEIYRVMTEEEGRELDLEDSDVGEGEGEAEEEGNRTLPESGT